MIRYGNLRIPQGKRQSRAGWLLKFGRWIRDVVFHPFRAIPLALALALSPATVSAAPVEFSPYRKILFSPLFSLYPQIGGGFALVKGWDGTTAFNVGDLANTALRVTVVAGAAGGGAAQTQVRNAADAAWVNVGLNAANAKMPVRPFDSAGDDTSDDANNAWRVNCVTGCVAGGSFADSTAFTFGTTPVSNTAFVVDDTATNTVAENSAGAARMSTNRIQYVDLSQTAARIADDAGNQIPSVTADPATTARGINVRVVADDPCTTKLATPKPISVTADTELVALSGSTHVYICSINLIVAAATNVAITSGTGTICATSEAGVFGGATAATGWNFAANGGLAFGNGKGMVGRTVDAGDALCINVSAANQVSGSLTYVQQ